MVIDLQRKVIKVQLRRFISLILFLLIEISLWFIIRTDVILGINKKIILLTLLIGFIAYRVIEHLLEYNYIYYSDKDDKIIFRYFSMSYFSKQKKSIEIPKTQFGGYEIEESLMGYKKNIILVHKIGQKEAKYPSVSISSLSKEEFGKITKSLDGIKVK